MVREEVETETVRVDGNEGVFRGGAGVDAVKGPETAKGRLTTPWRACSW